MGKRGPKPLPDGALVARGSNVPRTRERKREQLKAVTIGSPSPPKWMNDEERGVWESIVPTLRDMGVMSRADSQALGRYCSVVVEWVAVTEKMRNLPRLVKGSDGVTPYVNPYVKLKSELARELQSLEDRFGLTPSARMTLNVTAMFRPGGERTAAEPGNADLSKLIGGEQFFR